MIAFIFMAMLQNAAPTLIDPPAPAEVAAQEPLPQSVMERRERHAIRCRDRTVLGSRIGARVCMSEADLEQQREETQSIADDAHRSGATANNGVSFCRGASC